MAKSKRKAPEELPELNFEDPLSEPTVGRRCLAALLPKLGTKAEIAHRLRVSWSTVNDWHRTANPAPETLGRIRGLTGYSLDQLMQGHAAEEPILDEEALRSVLRRLNAMPDERADFAHHVKSDDGRYQDITETYVSGFLNEYRSAAELGASRQDAIRAGTRGARNAVAARTADREGRSPLDTHPEPVRRKRS